MEELHEQCEDELARALDYAVYNYISETLNPCMSDPSKITEWRKRTSLFLYHLINHAPYIGEDEEDITIISFVVLNSLNIRDDHKIRKKKHITQKEIDELICELYIAVFSRPKPYPFFEVTVTEEQRLAILKEFQKPIKL